MKTYEERYGEILEELKAPYITAKAAGRIAAAQVEVDILEEQARSAANLFSNLSLKNDALKQKDERQRKLIADFRAETVRVELNNKRLKAQLEHESTDVNHTLSQHNTELITETTRLDKRIQDLHCQLSDSQRATQAARVEAESKEYIISGLIRKEEKWKERAIEAGRIAEEATVEQANLKLCYDNMKKAKEKAEEEVYSHEAAGVVFRVTPADLQTQLEKALQHKDSLANQLSARDKLENQAAPILKTLKRCMEDIEKWEAKA